MEGARLVIWHADGSRELLGPELPGGGEASRAGLTATFEGGRMRLAAAAELRLNGSPYAGEPLETGDVLRQARER